MTLPFREWRRLRRRALRAQQRDQSEVCGLMGVDEQETLFLYFGRNYAGPGSWKLIGPDIERIESVIDENEHRLIGTFHSHPISEPLPGKRDREAMDFSEGYQMIYDVCAIDARMWKRTAGTDVQEIPLRIVKSPNK